MRDPWGGKRRGAEEQLGRAFSRQGVWFHPEGSGSLRMKGPWVRVAADEGAGGAAWGGAEGEEVASGGHVVVVGRGATEEAGLSQR